MKLFALISALLVLAGTAYAQSADDLSFLNDLLSESDTSATASSTSGQSGSISAEAGVFNSASVSGEININLPYDPSEEETFNSASDMGYPNYSLNSAADYSEATNVRTGPEVLIMFMIAILLGVAYFEARMYIKKKD